MKNKVIKKIVCVIAILIVTFTLTGVPCFAFPSYGTEGENYIWSDIPYTLYLDKGGLSGNSFLPSVNVGKSGGNLGAVRCGEFYLQSIYTGVPIDYNLAIYDNDLYYDYNEYGSVSYLSLDELEKYPSSVYLTVDEGYVISTKISDLDEYALGANCLYFGYLLPKGIDIETVSANCRIEFNSWYKSVNVDGGQGSIDYSSELVNFTVGTDGFGQEYIDLSAGYESYFDPSDMEFFDIYMGSGYYDVVTVKFYPYAFLQEFAHNFKTENGDVTAIVGSDFKVTPSLTVGGQDPSYYDWLDSIVDLYDRETVEEIGDAIMNGRNFCIALGFGDTNPLDNDYQEVNAENYLDLMGGVINFQKVSLDNFNLVSWLGDTIGGVLDVPIIGNVSLGTVLYVCVGLGLAFVILKFFVGG